MRQGNDRLGRIARLVSGGIVASLVLTGIARAETTVPPLEDFSPGFLGMYRKLMEIEDEIRRHADRYGVDVDLARAVCLYESGGNAGLASHAGAQGYFQVMPRTYRAMRVSTNIEAGVKYLAQMIRQFGREDRAVAAYNGGPGRVGRNGGLPLETLQYVVGVGHYRTVLKLYDEALRYHASRLGLTTVRSGDDWQELAGRLGILPWELRLHNPFLAGRRLRAGQVVAYPPEPRRDLLTPMDGGVIYRMRHGDNYIKVALTLGLELDALRQENGLWQIQSVPAGVLLRLPLSIDRGNVIRQAMNDLRSGPFTPSMPPIRNTAAASDEESPDGSELESQLALAAATVPDEDEAEEDTVSEAPVPPPVPAVVIHRVRRGDTLTSIARRYGTTVSAIQRENGLKRTIIQVGQRLRIPRGRSQEV